MKPNQINLRRDFMKNSELGVAAFSMMPRYVPDGTGYLASGGIKTFSDNQELIRLNELAVNQIKR
ncbi:hypothetical protein [Pedobacter steynii]|uniref:Uncharacterized protein n=1 Tax=Pedobacter steynii TaxID=430522 RepID=A0A1D7QK13_9SPHI|nr:hypothetical protein [Pedobacter steynii]AOM78939.1 hypothetical protein BFS30_18250 [Pedobacter steynii]